MKLHPAGLILGICLGSCADLSNAGSVEADDDNERRVMERFLGVLERTPRRGTALDRVYGFHVERGELDSLIQTYRDRTSKDPKDGAAWLLLGLVESQRGRDGAAVAAFRTAEEFRPDDPLPAYYLGQALVLVGQPAAAVEAFERALTRHPARTDLLDIYQALGRVHQRARRDDQALSVWSRLEKLFPDDPKVQEQIASALAEESRFEPALARFEAMANSARDPFRRVRFRTEAADLKVKLGRQADALRDYEGLLAGLDPESWIFREVRRKVEDVFLRDDDRAGLAKYYERWLEKSPEDVDAMARLGKTLAAQGRSAEARGWFDRALKLAPSSKNLRLALIEQLANERKFAEAAAQFEAMSRVEPNNPDHIRDWGRMLLRDVSKPEADRKRAAAEVWRRLVLARPDDPSTASQVADLFRQAGMVDEAIVLSKKAVGLAPGSPQYREYLGEYYHHLKRPDDALATWRGIADGPDRNASTLGRLAEILDGFGYKAQAIEAVEEACRLDPASLALRLRFAGLLAALKRFDEAEAQLIAAGPLAEDEEHREEVLGKRIGVDESAGRLLARVEALKAELAWSKAADPAAWRTLARYAESARQPVEATVAAEKAVTLDPKSIASRVTLARLYEATGRLGEAADASRALASLDRRARSEHLSNVAKLEVRLGRKAEALQAGREVLAASPGNPEALQLYSELCFQLGEDEEGLQALRKAVRANETDVRVLVNLAEALAREFRTEEAIELFWRAFEKASDLDAKLGYIARLADLHLRRNQFDRLTARLERLQGEEGRRREATFCLAQAYASLGDYGSARHQLESLLEANARDVALLKQLSKLAEDEGDYPAALKFQQRLREVAPDAEVDLRLAQLALRAGEVDLAESIWSRTTDAGQDLARVLSALDNLGSNGRHEVVLATTGRLLRTDPNNWEVLYREARSLAALNRPDEAAVRYRAILGLRLDDEEVGAIVKARRKKAGGSVSPASTSEGVGLTYRLASGYRTTQGILGLVPGYPASLANSWSPTDFGLARMAALAHEIARVRRDGTEAEWLAGRREATARGPVAPRLAWDDFYVALLIGDPRSTYQSAKALVRSVGHEPKADYAFLGSMMNRNAPSGAQVVRVVEDTGPDRSPPLPNDEVDLVRDALRTLLRAKSPWLTAAILEAAMGELRRAGRLDEFEPDYRSLVDSATDYNSITVAESAAADRGDAEALRKLSDAFYRQPSGSRSAPVNAAQSYYVTTPQGTMPVPAYHMARAMKAMADEKRYDEILRLVDDEMTAIQSPARIAERARAGRSFASSAAAAPNRYPVFTTNRAVLQTVDYPTPNRHLDSGTLLLLRGAFTFFKRDDHLGEWLAHLKKAAADASKDPSAERQARLALSAVLWWAEDRDSAVVELSRVVELSPGDVELKFLTAEVRSLRREFDEALAVVDSVEAVDQDVTRRRELLALRLAVQARRPDRAGQAAERLFGLRLDSATQVQLAAQMHQLGMHDLADAVLARARRQVGNNASALLELMAQYQRQGNVDSAVQIALQLLRRSTGQSTRVGAVEDPAQRQAIEVLAGSGKLKEMIERVEGQVRNSPKSLVLQQTLATYYRAAGRLDKLKATQETIIQLRPDDTSLRMQAANQLVQSGDFDSALDHYRAAFKVDPSLLSYLPTAIFTTFQKANRTDELVKLIDQVGLKTYNDPLTIRTLVESMLKDPKTFDQGSSLLLKAWEAYPNDRSTLLLAALTVEPFWTRADAYDLAKGVVLPRDDVAVVAAWAGFDSAIPIGGWGQDGRVTTLATRLLDAASRPGKFDDLSRSIEATLARRPGWQAGKALLASVRIRLGRVDEGRAALETLLDDPDVRPPFEALMVLGQVVRDVPSCEPLALAIYERASRTDRALSMSSLHIKPSAYRHLALLYRKAGRDREAIAIARKTEEGLRGLGSFGSPVLAAYRRANFLTGLGSLYLELGDPADALRIFDEIQGSPDEIQMARAYPTRDIYPSVDSLIPIAREGVGRALNGLDRGTLAPTLEALVRPLDAANPVDLLLVIDPREVDRASVKSLLASALDLAARDPAVLARLKADLDGLAKARPGDFTARVAVAQMACLGDDPGTIAIAAESLDRLANESPLEVLPAGTRAGPRHREEAARRLGLWLVARACWRHDSTSEIGDRLASKALGAARLQADPSWTLAMLRESGQRSLDRGDRKSAEARWSALLDAILESLLVPASPPRAPSTGRPNPRPRAPALSIHQFRQAAELSRLAAENGMADLSLRAIRDALKGGPPIVPVAMSPTSTTVVLSAASTVETPPDPVSVLVESKLIELDGLWDRAKFSPESAYETLRDLVLPPARPAEVFLYDPSTPKGSTRPSEVGRILVRKALALGQLDDLRQRIGARQESPSARSVAQRLLASIAETQKAR